MKNEKPTDSQLVTQAREVLWPGGNQNHSWGADTIEDVARILQPADPFEDLKALASLINNLECEYQANLDYPGFVTVSPRPLVLHPSLSWAWGFEGNALLGNDCCDQRESVTLHGAKNSTGALPVALAGRVVQAMREHLFRRYSVQCQHLTALSVQLSKNHAREMEILAKLET